MLKIKLKPCQGILVPYICIKYSKYIMNIIKINPSLPPPLSWVGLVIEPGREEPRNGENDRNAHSQLRHPAPLHYRRDQQEDSDWLLHLQRQDGVPLQLRQHVRDPRRHGGLEEDEDDNGFRQWKHRWRKLETRALNGSARASALRGWTCE